MTGRRELTRRHDEGGAVLIEFALVAMFLVVLMMGAYDYGQGWRAGLAVNEATRTGARVGSAMGRDRLADYYILSGAKAALDSSGRLGSVERVVIFRATSANGRVPDACKSATTIGTGTHCNVMTGDEFRGAFTESNFHATTGCFIGPATRQRWCPNARSQVQASADYVGIWITYTHDHHFGFLSESSTVARQTVMRLEPLQE